MRINTIYLSSFSEWFKNLTPRFHKKHLHLKKYHLHPHNTSRCHLNYDGQACEFAVVDQAEHYYYGTEWVTLLLSDVVKCVTHCTGRIDLLRYKGKITVSRRDERVCVELLNDTLQQHGTEAIITIMVTDQDDPNPNKFTHYTEELVVDIFRKLYELPNLYRVYKSYCHAYAKHAEKLYGKCAVSFNRLYNEAFEVFISHKTFNHNFVHFYRNYLHPKVLLLKRDMAFYAHREFSVDGTQPVIDATHIQMGHKKVKFDACFNGCTGGGTGLILSESIYPGKRESNQNICDLLVDPPLTSLKVSPMHVPLDFGIGIDHAVRDFGVAALFVATLKDRIQQEFDVATDGTFITPTSIKYNVNDITARVKQIFLILILHTTSCFIIGYTRTYSFL